ncbi:MAG: hypothetical protein SYR96_39785, partial [Actinomycetota bacterium]|nr:hypothetical protein [Actinomycetota bacterium]
HGVRAVDSGIGLPTARTEGIDADDVHAKLLFLLTEKAVRARAEHVAGLQRAGGGLPAAADLLTDLIVGSDKSTEARQLWRLDHGRGPYRSS